MKSPLRSALTSRIINKPAQNLWQKQINKQVYQGGFTEFALVWYRIVLSTFHSYENILNSHHIGDLDLIFGSGIECKECGAGDMA